MAAIAIWGCAGSSEESGSTPARMRSEEGQRTAGEDTIAGSEEGQRTSGEDTIAGSEEKAADADTALQNAGQEGETENGNSKELEILEEAAADSGQGNENTLKFSIAAVPGLPEDVAAQINRINSGELLKDITGLEELENFYALIGAKEILAVDPATGEEAVGRGELTLYVPNLLSGLSDVSVLFYDKAAGEWRVVPAEQTDTVARTVTAVLPGSGVLTVIYRNRNRSVPS